ncbi:MAG TPA: DNA-binding response regulator, partial [Coriobacteriia bacterium]|nr:DNA-binding response regulator [Coriobacteriia bacterium]
MPSILIVEDDRMILSGLDYALEQEGYRVVCAANVKEARVALADTRFDLALLDMNLPDGTGFDVHAALTEAHADTAVMFLTVVDDEGNVVRAFEEGAADYITKPFRLRELLARVKRALRTHAVAATAEDASRDIGADARV